MEDRLTIGVEEEFLVVERDSGALVPRSHEVLDAARPTLGDRVEPELNRCEIEVATPVRREMDDVEHDLTHLRHTLSDAADPCGLGVVGLGTHPFSRWEGQRVDTDSRRFEEMEDRYRIVAREQVICGCHVHVGIDDPDLVVGAMTRLRPYLATVLGLSANSPFWNGLDSGYASYRTQVWQRWPTAGMPPMLRTREEYDVMVDQLVTSGTMDDASHLYWYARPSLRYPTLEVRVADVCQTPGEAAGVAALIRGLVWRSLDEAERSTAVADVPTEVLEGAVWRAARYGMSGDLVGPTTGSIEPAGAVLDEVVDHARPGLEAAGDVERVEGMVRRLSTLGTGADRQRAELARRSEPRDVVDAALSALTDGAVAAPGLNGGSPPDDPGSPRLRGMKP